MFKNISSILEKRKKEELLTSLPRNEGSLTREIINVNDIEMISATMISDNIQVEQSESLRRNNNRKVRISNR